jgi:hypothetical protein
MAYINSLTIFKSNFSSIPFVFCQFFTWIAVGDADLRFSLILVRKTSAAEEPRGYITNVIHTRD